MHDLGYNPDAHAIDERTRYDLPAVKRIDAAALRTVSMPDLRSADARTLDARARGLDCRTADDKVLAELVRIVDCLQALTLRLDVFAEEQARVIAELTAYIRDHSEADE